jgi:hypothetical protein
VRLSAEAAAAVPRPSTPASAAPRPSTSASAAAGRSGEISPKLARPRANEGGPATLGRPAVATGTLVVDSRPSGAAVTIDGKPSGTTPLTLSDLPPADYRVVMSMKGFQDFAITVRVIAGERVRAAASLTALEQQ